MSVLARIFAWFRLDSARRKRIAELRVMARAALLDGVLSDDELSALVARQRALGLSDEDVRFFRNELFQMALTAAAADRRVTPKEEESLERIARHFNLAGKIERSREHLARFRLLYEIDQGNLPSVDVSGLVLQRGEVAHWAEPAAILEERVVSREYVGGSHGVSFRIAKGVSYRVGAQRGRMVSKTAVVPVSRGALVLTNKRVVFAGDRKSFSHPWARILALNLFEDGAQISSTTRSAPAVVQFENQANAEIVGAVVSQLLTAA